MTLWRGVLLFGLAGLSSQALGQDGSPNDWLDRMAGAVQTSNYEGTVIRVQNDQVQALKDVRAVRDGVIHEKVVIQEGNGLEIIRNGNEVQCILPDKKSVLVEEWNDQSTLFSSLPSSDIQFGSEYDVSIVREDRVMGQEGDAIEQVKFADIRLNAEIHDNALAPSINIDSFRWFTQPKRQIRHSVDSSWSSDDLPPGFRVVSTHEETLAGRDATVTHILFSDGLANVSVFIEPAGDRKIAQRSSVGSSNSFSVEHEGYQVTAVGDVPAPTVEKIASSMRPN